MNPVILETIDLSIGYHSRKRGRSLVDGLNLKLLSGKLTCLIGANGTGKSTLLRTLAGLQKPVKGGIKLAGKDLACFAPEELARKVSVVLTDASHPGDLSVNQVVELGRLPYTNWLGNLSTADYQIVDQALHRVKAGHLTGRNFGELSDGERQKIMIARALAQQPDVMILDEPTAFLDWPNRVDLLLCLGEIAREENRAILISSHDLELVLQMTDEVWVLDTLGKIVTGKGIELLDSNALDMAFSGRYTSLLTQHTRSNTGIEITRENGSEQL